MLILVDIKIVCLPSSEFETKVTSLGNCCTCLLGDHELNNNQLDVVIKSKPHVAVKYWT